MDTMKLEKLAKLFRLRQRLAYRKGLNEEAVVWARAREDLHITMHNQGEEGHGYDADEFLDTMICQISEKLDGEHTCLSTTTSDGHGAYCEICGETIA